MDETADNGLSEADAEAALLETLMGNKPSGEGDGSSEEDDGEGEYDEYTPNPEDLDGDEEGTEGATEGEEGEEGGESEEDEGVQAPTALDDTHEIALTLDGTEHKVSLGDLKALYGAREEISRKDQEVDRVGAEAAATIQTALAIIDEDRKPYANVDWMILQAQVDPETFAWHRANAKALDDKYEKLVGAAKGVEQSFIQRRQNVDREASAAALKELQADIPEWSEQVYTDILKYGATQGLDAQELATVTNPKVIKLIRKAMLHDKAAQITTKKVAAAPVKALKGAKTANPAGKQINAQKAMKRLQATGSDDAAVAALLARM